MRISPARGGSNTGYLPTSNRHFFPVKVSEQTFHSPVRAGEIIECLAAMARQGRTSLTLQLEVQVHEPVPDLHRDVTSAAFEMVAINEARQPEPSIWKSDMVRAAQLPEP